MNVEITQESFDQYLVDLDPILQRLQALTEELVDARKALSVAQVSGAQIIALIHACDVATAMLPELSNALLDAKGRLAGMAPSDGETSTSG